LIKHANIILLEKIKKMKAIVSIIMGSTSDLKVMEQAAKLFDEFEIPFEINALSAHRTPQEVEKFASTAKERGIKVIIAAAGMAAHLPGVIAAYTTIPVIGVPINASLDGVDALLAIVQMPPGIPVATVGINAATNAALLAIQMLALSDEKIDEKLKQYKSNLKQKIVNANNELSKLDYKYKV
jgi:5-(carboxyamino)imidazole ribonucleotide mutase